ncbi:DUF2087 domain-containing protein [Bacillus sp. HMF5848]|uniref:DUF2087 domain-containing protein n=1 Tax=Bacillus sp. HMF5848 TaxID=2495421 RepID=UPI000F7AC87C|nr:DUF2087 domain-containing protein [Bacillus sp. HMF5848]RSK26713.1 DUF2087 domain-containing protein [Bacillus sp. HMF5848]
MQLNQLVNFHKTIGDPTRVRILVLLANGPLHGQALAGKLGLTPATVTHHISKLREIDVIHEKRVKNTIYFSINEAVLKRKSDALMKVVFKREEGESMQLEAKQDKQTMLKNFLTKEGRLKNIPAQKKKKLIVLEFLAKGLVHGRKYSEAEINEYIKQYHEDFATLRRELIMNHFMFRENAIYELNPEEMWDKVL